MYYYLLCLFSFYDFLCFVFELVFIYYYIFSFIYLLSLSLSLSKYSKFCGYNSTPQCIYLVASLYILSLSLFYLISTNICILSENHIQDYLSFSPVLNPPHILDVPVFDGGGLWHLRAATCLRQHLPKLLKHP